MALYESTIIARQDLAPADITKLTDGFSALVSEQGGKTVKTEYWGLRNLAYRIKKSRKGHYAFLGLDASGEAIKELDRKLRLNEDVIRHLIVRVDAISEEPSPALQSNRGDDEKEAGGFSPGGRPKRRGPRRDFE